jgi:hypothetical protein
MQLREREASRAVPSTKGFVARETARWLAINVAGGALLFWLAPRAVEKAGYSFAIANAVVLSAVQIHHFFVDGVIWKLKNPKVSNPLLEKPLRDPSSPHAAAAPIA